MGPSSWGLSSCRYPPSGALAAQAPPSLGPHTDRMAGADGCGAGAALVERSAGRRRLPHVRSHGGGSDGRRRPAAGRGIWGPRPESGADQRSPRRSPRVIEAATRAGSRTPRSAHKRINVADVPIDVVDLVFDRGRRRGRQRGRNGGREVTREPRSAFGADVDTQPSRVLASGGLESSAVAPLE